MIGISIDDTKVVRDEEDENEFFIERWVLATLHLYMTISTSLCRSGCL